MLLFNEVVFHPGDAAIRSSLVGWGPATSDLLTSITVLGGIELWHNQLVLGDQYIKQYTELEL